jgi:hypothetical protein
MDESTYKPLQIEIQFPLGKQHGKQLVSLFKLQMDEWKITTHEPASISCDADAILNKIKWILSRYVNCIEAW